MPNHPFRASAPALPDALKTLGLALALAAILAAAAAIGFVVAIIVGG